MQDLNYRVLVSCRDIIYPGGADIFNYVTWANPASGKAPIRLGEIGLGKVEFKVKEPFNTLFVTKERTENPKTPSGNVVMRGNVEVVSFLDSPSANSNKPSELATPATSQSPTPRSTTSRNPLNWLKIGGAIAFVALFATFLVIFLITRR
jgi:hypothetical protein